MPAAGNGRGESGYPANGRFHPNIWPANSYLTSHTTPIPDYYTLTDFNNDGKLDLAAVNSDRDTVSLMLGFGDGLFAAPQSYPVAGRPFSISVADFAFAIAVQNLTWGVCQPFAGWANHHCG